MTFGDSLSIDVGSGATTLNRVSVGDRQSVFESVDQNIRLSLLYRQLRNGRWRKEIRVYTRKTATDPLYPTQNAPFEESAYFVLDVPAVGYTTTEQKTLGTGLFTLLTASTNANLIKLTQMEI
jgi:hypothetical protein